MADRKQETHIRRALSQGKREAAEVVRDRDEALQFRREAPMLEGPEPAALPEKLVRRAGGRGSAGLLVAEGDSWFDFPGTDILQALEDGHGYDIESVAHKGDLVEGMAYGGQQLTKFTRLIERVIRRGEVPVAILLSGGGNDVAGDEFAVLLNHARSPTPGLNMDVVRGIIHQRIMFSYITILTAVTEICKKRLGRTLPVLVHGYDYPVADGRGFWGGWWKLPGPWLEPGFRQKGFADREERFRITKAMIDEFNKMLKAIVALPELSHVRHVDLRGTLSSGHDYRDWWSDELHPSATGFKLVAEKFVASLPT